MEETILPPHEKLKRELADKFTATNTYLGSHVKKTIVETDFKILKQTSYPPEQIKKGDVLILPQGSKSRPCVVAKVLKDRTCIYIPLTSTDNIHCLTPYKSRFFKDGCFCKSVDLCSEEQAIRSFVGVFDNMRALNSAIKEIKQFIIENI
jgi:hypothetical protein